MAPARSSSPTRFSKPFSVLFVALLSISVASAFEFRVGGEKGWVNPAGGGVSESYNHWARRNRFHVGDSVYFKYSNDSVLVVDREGYHECNTTAPLLKFADGSTMFRFDRYGFFYFISGQPGHCESGQKLIIRVMVHTERTNPGPGPAPFPEPSGGGGGSDTYASPSGAPSSNGALRVAAAGAGSSVLMAELTGLAFIVMMFV